MKSWDDHLFDCAMQEALHEVGSSLDTHSENVLREFANASVTPSLRSRFRMWYLTRKVKKALRPKSPGMKVAINLSIIALIITAPVTASAFGFDLLTLLFSPKSQYTAMELTESITESDMFDGFEISKLSMGVYLPDYIPEGYVLAEVYGSETTLELYFFNENHNMLMIRQKIYDGQSQIHADTENASFKDIKLTGMFDAYLITKNDFIGLYTYNPILSIIIESDSLRENDVIRIAKHLVYTDKFIDS